MRKLNKKQKELVKYYYRNDMLDSTNVEYYSNIVKLKLECEKINDYETLYTDINRLISDLDYTDDYVKTIDNFI